MKALKFAENAINSTASYIYVTSQIETECEYFTISNEKKKKKKNCWNLVRSASRHIDFV